MTVLAPLARCAAVFAITVTPIMTLADNHIEDVVAAQYALDQAFADGDVEKIRSLVTPDHVAITPYYPSIKTTEEQIASLKEANYTLVRDGDPIYRTISEDNDVVTVTVTKSYTGTWGDYQMPDRAISTSIWSLYDGKWLQNFYQETSISASMAN